MRLIAAALLAALDDSDPTEGALLRAWIELQKADPRTLILEKKETSRYRFGTSRFPFDGELKVLSAVVDPSSFRHEYGVTIGTVEVELLDWSDEAERKHWEAYQAWLKTNRLVFDERKQAWVAWNAYDWSRTPSEEELNSAGWILMGVLGALLVWGFVATRRQTLRVKAALELARRSAELQEQSLVLLREIRDALRPPGQKP